MPMCPRCATALTHRTLQDARFDVCGHCGGLLLLQPDLVRMLRALTAACPVGTDDIVASVGDQPGDIDCPRCARPMETFGYMETRLAMLDRCSPCRLVWVDGSELETVVRLFARTSARANEKQEELNELSRHLTAVVYGSMSPTIRI